MSAQSTAGRITRQCQHCRAEFQTWACQVRIGGGKFCSHACYAADKSATAERIETPCRTCGKVMRVRAYVVARGWGKYCSDPCMRQGRRNRVDCVCAICGKTFQMVASNAERNKHCSRKCRNQHLRTRPLPTMEERFWSKVKKVGDCWEWTGATNECGYGIIGRSKREQSSGNKVFLSHRISYEMHNGPTNGLFVCHRCDNTRCVRPDHLFLGTHRDNMTDKVLKGRAAKKLDNDKVRDIRRRYANSEASQRALASEYGVSVTTIVHVLRRRTFKHVD